jgi:hypothetical protein
MVDAAESVTYGRKCGDKLGIRRSFKPRFDWTCKSRRVGIYAHRFRQCTQPVFVHLHIVVGEEYVVTQALAESEVPRV